MIKILAFFLAILLIQSCKSNQDEIFKKFENDFSAEIQKSNAKPFEYQYDGLTNQKSYFVGCKLKFMTLQMNGESSTVNYLISFDNDSISKIIQRNQIYDEKESGGRNWEKIEIDSVNVIDAKRRTKDIYQKNKLLKSANFKLKENSEFFMTAKKQTENHYICPEL